MNKEMSKEQREHIQDYGIRRSDWQYDRVASGRTFHEPTPAESAEEFKRIQARVDEVEAGKREERQIAQIGDSAIEGAAKSEYEVAQAA